MAQSADDLLVDFARERGGWLIRCAYLLTRGRHSAHDLAQDTLTQAWRARDRVAAAQHPDRYVLRIMLNLHRSAARKGRLREVDLDEALHLTSHDDLAGVDRNDQMAAALAALTLRQRQVLVLRYWADLDDIAIAEVLGCRRATVRSLAARGIASLRSEMEAHYDG